jgi:hypothetical protein
MGCVYLPFYPIPRLYKRFRLRYAYSYAFSG